MFLHHGAATGPAVREAAREAEHRLLAALRGRAADPRVAAGARVLSLAGEHGAVWLVTGLTGAAADPVRRGAWLRGTALVAAAHLTSMGLKRAVRRPRPGLGAALPPVLGDPLVRTTGRHSFPSSHAASAVAAAVALGALLPGGARHAAMTPLAAAMCVSRLVAGVHYPSDVAAGAALGALTVRLGGLRPHGSGRARARGGTAGGAVAGHPVRGRARARGGPAGVGAT